MNWNNRTSSLCVKKFVRFKNEGLVKRVSSNLPLTSCANCRRRYADPACPQAKFLD